VTDALFFLDRRRFFVGAVSAFASSQLGCSKPEAVLEPIVAQRNDVPLRVLMVVEQEDGEQEDKDAVVRGWGSVADQPLEIEMVSLDRSKCMELESVVLQSAKKADVLVYPLVLVGAASRSDAVIQMTTEDLTQMDSQIGSLLASARNAASRYGGDTYALPLGCTLPALISSEVKVESPDSWQAYDRLVADQWGGAAAEPTAPGWAGMMFLWRLVGMDNWLFERENLDPLINTQPYVKALDLMLRTHSRYTDKYRTPDQIWLAVSQGKLQGGIGFPRRRSGNQGQVQLASLPGVTDLSKVLLDPFSPVISLSASCRQTEASKRFIQWFCGGEGSRTVRSQVAGMSDLRDDFSLGQDATAYDAWLADQLQAPLSLPCLQLDRAAEYLTVLDQQVTKALRGEVASQAALDAVAARWGELTSEVGTESQLRAWRMAQGMPI